MNIFIEKSLRKYSAKASPRPLYNFDKTPNTKRVFENEKSILDEIRNIFHSF